MEPDKQSHFLDRLAAGESLLGRKPRSIETDAIDQDTFDHRVYRELLDEAPALSELAYEELGKKYDYTEELVGDTVMAFWKGDPELHSQKVMHPNFLINREVARDILEAPETANTRAFTTHDKYGAAMATLAIANKIKDSLDKAREAKAQADAAAEAQKDFMEAMQALMDMLGGMPGGSGEGEPMSGQPSGQEGPLTEEQQAMLDALQEAIDALEAAGLSMEATLEDAENSANALGAQLRGPIREAIQEAGDMLAEEQELFSAWGVEDGELKEMSFEERQQLARSLKANRLNDFRKLIGRFRTMAAAQRSKKTEFSRDEAYSVEMSGRLEDVLQTEFSKLANRHARLEFLAALDENALLSKKYRGIEKIGQGAIICLVDNSGSMTIAAPGSPFTREAFAKAFALALLDQARAANRDFVGINFSSANQVSIFRFPKGKAANIKDVLRFIEEFFSGGTDYMRPLDMAMDLLEAEFNDAGTMRGDLVMITDDDCRVTPEWMRAYQDRKEKLAFRTFGVAVGTHAGNALGALSDDVRSITEFTDPMAVADIFRTV